MLARFVTLFAVLILLSPPVMAKAVRVAILDFVGPGSGGSAMADAIELELELADDLVLVPRKKIQRRLRKGRQRLSADSVANAVRGRSVDLIMCGQGKRLRRGFTIHLSVFRPSGSLFFAEDYKVNGKGPDVETLGSLMAESLTDAIAEGGVAEPQSAVDDEYPDDEYPDAEYPDTENPSDGPASSSSGDSSGDDDLFVDDDELNGAASAHGPIGGDADKNDRASGRRPIAGTSSQADDSSSGGSWGARYKDDKAPQRESASSSRDDDDWDRRVMGDRDSSRPRRSAWDDDTRGRRAPQHDSIADIDEGKTGQDAASGAARDLIPTLMLSGGFDLQQWLYDLKSDTGTSKVDWGPSYGGSLHAVAWLLPYVGVEAGGSYGTMQIDLSRIPGLEQKAIEVFVYSAQLQLRGQYVLTKGWPGFAVGGRLGYRLLMTNAAPQSPFTVVPSVTAHMLSPGLDLRLPLHPQYAVLNIGAELLPFGVYSEAPDEPGAAGSASMLGFRLDLTLRSFIAYGVFAELHGYYEQINVGYTDAGTRSAITGGTHVAGQVVGGLRGLNLRLGWSF